MLSTCAENELPNPHKNCIREILSTLVCYDNDMRRIKCELRDVQKEFKIAIAKIEFRCLRYQNKAGVSGSTEDASDPSDSILDFSKHVATIDEVNECFTQKIDKLKAQIEEIYKNAKECLHELHTEKCRLKRFHEKSVDQFKRVAIKSDDPIVVRNCEKDICELQERFSAEATYIKKCEEELMPFLKQLQDFDSACECCCLEEYEWIPQGKSLHMAEEAACQIKKTMGPTLRAAFAALQVQQPTDHKSFLANYLVHSYENELRVKAKLELLEFHKKMAQQDKNDCMHEMKKC